MFTVPQGFWISAQAFDLTGTWPSRGHNAALQVNNFQNQAKKLPKALRDWQAFVDCKKVIDDFLEELPLFQQLAHKSMRPRQVP